MLAYLPEIILLAVSLVALLLAAFFEKKPIITLGVVGLGLFSVLIVLLSHLPSVTPSTHLSGHFKLDDLAVLLKLFVVLLTLFTLVYSYQSPQLLKTLGGEFFVIILLSVLGMMVLISASSLISAYLGVELISLSLYGLISWDKRSSAATEAAIKYFILSSISSAFLLYGMSLIYGATGTLIISDIYVIADSSQNQTLLLLGLVFLIISVAFKLGNVPFHMWLPDVYHGAPTQVTMFLSSVPKLAFFALLFRLWFEGLSPITAELQPVLIIIAVASIIIGNLVAIAQTNIKRMLAYSSIAHMGFVILGVLTMESEGIAASLFYIVIYGLMSLSAFAIVLTLSSPNKDMEALEDYKGLSARSPWYAFLLLIVMFSLAGIPPTAGFYAKLAILKALFDVELYALPITALVMSVIASFYYLRVIKLAFFDRPHLEKEVSTVSTSAISTLCRRPILCIILSINVLALIFLGVFPETLLAWSLAAIN